MQHGTDREAIGDILENAIAVLRGLRERKGVPVGDVIVNLETALVKLDKLREERSPFDTLREDPFLRQPVLELDPDDCTWCQGPCQVHGPYAADIHGMVADPGKTV